MNLKAIHMGSGLVVLGAGLVLSGCGGPINDANDGPTPSVKKVTYTPQSQAGIGASVDADPSELTKLYVSASSKYGSARKDPFALTKDETAFETSQTGQKAFNDLGWELDYVPAPEVEVIPYLEPQPYRRLAGVVVGDSVLAIIEMGDGSEPQIVRPGQKIPNTDWTVVSIDQEKAVLHRDGNVLPKDVTVRLETPRPGTPGYNAGGGPGAGAGGPGFQGGGGGVGPGGKARPGLGGSGGGGAAG